MAYRTLDPREVELALERIDGNGFEKFAQQFYGAIQGSSYVPLGGMHDGGAEGFDLSDVSQSDKPERYMQASIRADVRTKIRHTVRRLREYGRDPKQLIYLTSQVVAQIETEEQALSDELDVRISIRDAKFIAVHINDSPKTIQAFDAYLSGVLQINSHIGTARIVGESSRLPARSLCVFLGQEIERRRGNTQLLESVTDSLILWALEDTDPDDGKFLTRSEILSRVVEALPSSANFIRGVIDARLERLAAKDGTNDRAVRWYRKEDKFCLPFETREIVRLENSEDELLRHDVSDAFRRRVVGSLNEDDPVTTTEDVVRACHRTLEITFENQGLEMAHFVNGNGDDQPTFSVSDHLHTAIGDLGISGKYAGRVAELCLRVLRSTFYDSAECERIYLGKMSRTYIMMFILKNDVKVVEYFRNMSGEFNLYVGADILIRALSEYFLNKQDQMTINTLDILTSAGSSLVLTEKCLEEVWTHLKATDAEFLNHYAEMEPYIDLDIAQTIDRILIRSYFYARIDPLPGVRAPAGWRTYMGNFVEYKQLHYQSGREDLRKYLMERFKLIFETAEEMEKGLDKADVGTLTEDILAIRWRQKNAPEKERRLAENDALQVLRVYQKRQSAGELSHSNPYGFRTWWLTQSSSVRKATGGIVLKNNARYMMRPEFLLHFIALSPSEESVRRSFNTIFPTLLGIRLSSRMDSATFKSAMDQISDSFSVDEARARVRLENLSNQLKSDFFKQYDDLS